MSIRVKLASTPEEVRALLEVRHTVFVEEEGYLAPQGGAIVDLYDPLPTTVNLVALSGGAVGGGLRITVDSAAGMPADQFFDYRSVLPPDARAASCSMLCLRRSVRGQSGGRIIMGMLQMCIYWCHARGLTHLCCPINPRIARLMKPIGLEPVGEEFTDGKGLPTLPMLLDMAKLGRSYADFVERQDVGLWMDSFEREFYRPGEAIIRGGEVGREAYLVVDGGAAAVAHGTDVDGPVVQRFAPGDVFGELALLTDLPRSTTVVAKEPTDVMVIGRANFERQVSSNPELALSMMSSIGERFHHAVTGRRAEETA